MVSLFRRIRNTVVADLHEAIDHKERKNPIALLNQYLRDSEQEVKKVEKLIERHQLLKEEFHRELKHAEFMAKKRGRQSEIAERANEKALLDMAVLEKAQYEERTTEVTASYQNAITQLDELEQKYREMKLKISDMNMKRLELMGRENIARATQKINRTIEQADIGNAYSRFDEIEHYIENLEARVNASYEKSTFDARIAQLEKQLS